MRRALPEVFESLEELQSLLARTRDPQRKQRVHLLVLIQSKQVKSRLAAAAHLGVHRNSVGDWLAKYEAGGLNAMLEIGTRGAKPGIRSLSPAALEALKARLAGEGFESYLEVPRWIEREFDLKVQYRTMYGIVRYGLKSKLKRARPVHAKKNTPTPPTSPDG